MLQYLFKRLLLTLPALWILATLVFLLSRLLPGASGAEQILHENGGYYSKGSAGSRQEAYKAYLTRTGQHLPLFYFSFRSATDPDTLELIYPESERLFLQRLSWQFGNWPAVTAYYHRLKETDAAISHVADTLAHSCLNQLFTSTAPQNIRKNLDALSATVAGKQATYQVRQLQQAASKLITQQQPYAFYFPALQWHGTQNQYHRWVTDLTSGNAGYSYKDLRPVHLVIFDALSSTFWLVFISISIAFLLSLELSILFVRRRFHFLKKYLMPPLYLIDSIPVFVLALLLLVLFASPAFLQWFPVFGLSVPSATAASGIEKLGMQLQYLVLPTACLVIAQVPFLTSLIYRAVSGEQKADYARTARAKGLSESQVIRKHVLRNSLLPVITIFTDALPALLAGTVVVETIFAIPGMGRLLVNSVMARDYPVIVAIVLCVAVFRVMAYLLADIGYSLADPRIRHQNA